MSAPQTAEKVQQKCWAFSYVRGKTGGGSGQCGIPFTQGVFIDGTHIKASASTKKQVKAEIPVTAKRYAAELMEEANADREAHSKNCVKTVRRHIRKDYEELADDDRYTSEYHEYVQNPACA